MKPCGVSRYEPLFRRLLAAVFNSSLLLDGAVVDSGAHSGGESCYFASLDSRRIVHAIEPSFTNVALLHALVKGEPDLGNIRLFHGALGSEARIIDVRSSKHTRTMLKGLNTQPTSASNVSESFKVKVVRMDDLFATERLAFAHLDVEGAERDVLLGSTAVIARDRPVFTVEDCPSCSPDHTLKEHDKLIATIHKLDYSALVVPERCGTSRDCRNIICVPNERAERVPQVLAEMTRKENFTRSRSEAEA